MQRVSFFITLRQLKQLREFSKREGRSMSELFRLAIDKLLKEEATSTPPQTGAALAAASGDSTPAQP
ncbi:MAG TPA: ribbon-helix-helix protein, CopG family [Devosia sp.]|nr:ribbon-helix-helix protein, CopG family [Devosia sp.]